MLPTYLGWALLAGSYLPTTFAMEIDLLMSRLWILPGIFFSFRTYQFTVLSGEVDLPLWSGIWGAVHLCMYVR